MKRLAIRKTGDDANCNSQICPNIMMVIGSKLEAITVGTKIFVGINQIMNPGSPYVRNEIRSPLLLNTLF
jgi:hypothetical protein